VQTKRAQGFRQAPRRQVEPHQQSKNNPKNNPINNPKNNPVNNPKNSVEKNAKSRAKYNVAKSAKYNAINNAKRRLARLAKNLQAVQDDPTLDATIKMTPGTSALYQTRLT